MALALYFILFLMWGSFLNVLAYRLVHAISIVFPRSHCVYCKYPIAWYDLIPVISWLLLGRRCRNCKASISGLYPSIELLTAISLTLLFQLVPPLYFPAYFLFFSALIVSIRTDLETMLISRFVTLFLIPVGFVLTAQGFLPIGPSESTMGAIFGYGFLWLVATLFLFITGKQGMGQGDLELLAFIGAFTGPFGVWSTLFASTIIGSILGIIYLKLSGKSKHIKIPFGPFLATAAMMYVLFEPYFGLLLAPTSS